MKILKKLAIVALLGTFAVACQNSSNPEPQNVVVTPPDPTKPETIDPNKCYEGEVVWLIYCTKGIWVQVLNGNIGDAAEDPYPESYNQKKWTNAIWIANGQILKDASYNQDLMGKKIYFKLDPKSNPVDCQGIIDIWCLPTGFGRNPPKKTICASSISFNKCN